MSNIESTATYAHLAGDGRCCAKARSTGERCKNPAVTGKAVCRMHGGNSPSGREHGRWKHGRYSKHLPDKLAQRFEQTLQDPTLLELRAEIALVETRLGEILERIHEGDSRATWSDLRETTRKLRETSDERKATQLANRLVRTIESAGNDYRDWQEAYELIDRRRKLVDSENRHIRDQEQFVTNQQLMALMGAVLVIIRENVTDTQTRRDIVSDIDKLIESPAG